jgi:hypothetical protein
LNDQFPHLCLSVFGGCERHDEDGAVACERREGKGRKGKGRERMEKVNK